MRKILAILLSIFAFSSWVTSQVSLSLKPLAPEVKLVNGREYVPLSNGKIFVELAYDCRVEDKLLFDLVFLNKSEHPVFVSPLDFYYLNLDDPEGDSSRFSACLALSPQKPFTWHDRALEERPPGDESLKVLLEIPMMFAQSFSEAFGAGAPSSGMAEEQERVNRLKDLVRQHMFQEVELAPGEQASGFVYFPGSPETSYLLFCFPVGNHEFQFAYTVKKERWPKK